MFLPALGVTDAVSRVCLLEKKEKKQLQQQQQQQQQQKLQQ